jgi:hypothetical protein
MKELNYLIALLKELDICFFFGVYEDKENEFCVRCYTCKDMEVVSLWEIIVFVFIFVFVKK